MPTVLDEGVTIDGDLPPIADLTRTHELAAAKDGQTGAASVLQILELIERADLPADVRDVLDLAESALQAVPDGSVTTTKIADNNVTTAKILDANVTNAKLANMVQATVKGRAAGAGTGAPSDLAAADLFTILNGVFPARPQTASGVGQFIAIETASGSGYTLPAGGTWAWSLSRFNSGTGALTGGQSGSGVSAGATTVMSGIGGTLLVGWVWRIA